MNQEREDYAEPDGQAEHGWRFDWWQALGGGGLFVILMCAAVFGVAGYAYVRQFIPDPRRRVPARPAILRGSREGHRCATGPIWPVLRLRAVDGARVTRQRYFMWA